MDTRLKRSVLKGVLASLGFVGAIAFAATFNLFQPATGILVGNSSTYITSAAAWSNIQSLLSGTCNSTVFVRGDGACTAVPAGVVPGGANTNVQYNSSGAFAGNSGFTYDGSGNISLTGRVSATGLNNQFGTTSTGSFGAVLNVSSDTSHYSLHEATDGNGNQIALGVNNSGSTQVGLPTGTVGIGTTSVLPLHIATAGHGIFLDDNTTFSSGVVVGAPTGGNKGVGTLNAVGLYVGGVAVGTGGGSPGGSSGQVQYNSGGTFGGASNVTYSSSTGDFALTAPTSGNLLSLSGAVASTNLFNTNGVPNILMNGTVPEINIGGSSNGGAFAMIQRYSNAAGGPDFQMYHSRGASVGTQTILQSGDEIGSYSFSGSDGTTTSVKAARIIGIVDGAPSVGASFPARIDFYTTPVGSTSLALGMSLDNAGNLNLARGALNVTTTAASTTAIHAINDGAHDVEILASTSTAGNAQFRATNFGGTNWSFGNVRSSNNFALCVSATLTGTCPVQFTTNGLSHFFGNSSGATIQVDAPTSGSSPAIDAIGGASTPTLKLEATATNNAGEIAFFDSTNSVYRGWMGFGGTCTGQATGDLCITAGTGGLLQLGVPGSGGVVGPVAAVVNGTQTCVMSGGFVSNVNTTCTTTDISSGNGHGQYCIGVNNASGTSNASTIITITAGTSFRSTAANGVTQFIGIIDNGVEGVGCANKTVANSFNITKTDCSGTVGFTGSGTKGIARSFNLCYAY